MKKRRWLLTIVVSLLIVLIFTNPTEQQYIDYSEETIASPFPKRGVEIETINFILFSTYTPIAAHEYGVAHLGVLGQFVRISDGQFDYPMWLEIWKSLIK